MRRIIVLTAVAMITCLLLAACGSAATPTPAAETVTPGAAMPINSPTVETSLTPSGTVTVNVYSVTTDPNVTIENGVQVVKMVQTKAGYEPSAFTIQKGLPVRWEIDSQETKTCASKVRSEQLAISVDLVPGVNVVEFTPAQLGQVPFHCGMKDCPMGAKHQGSFNVVEPQA
jgi:hypothetical protein